MEEDGEIFRELDRNLKQTIEAWHLHKVQQHTNRSTQNQYKRVKNHESNLHALLSLNIKERRSVLPASGCSTVASGVQGPDFT